MSKEDEEGGVWRRGRERHFEKYFEQMTDTIYVERLFWLLGRTGPSGAGVDVVRRQYW